MPPKASKRKAANGYRLPDPIPEGEIFVDGKKKWRIGKSIGVGGFGEIYLCSDDITSKVTDDATRVMKVEPSENGPLFVEMHFYIRAATQSQVDAFKKEKKLSDIGIPCFRGKGLHTYKGQNYRFLVIDRFGKDLQKIFQSGKKLFSAKAAYNLAIRIIDTLEYIHHQGYVHNDIKAQNLLLGYGRNHENDIYLVDFGLVSKYKVNDVHLEYKPDARRAHDGTIEYTSRDAHIGAHSRRSDLEILGYNLVHWMSGNLPWMNNLANPANVHSQKKNFMKDIPAFLTDCFGEENSYPDVLENFLSYVADMEFDTKPDYDYCRSLFRDELRRLKLPHDGKVDFSASTKSPIKKRQKRKISYNNEPPEVEVPSRKSARTGSHPTPAASPSPETAHTRSAAPSNGTDWCWERILCSDPEMLIRQASRNSETEDDSPLAIQRRAVEKERQRQSLQNPTPVMLALMKKLEEREQERELLTWHQQLQHLTGKKYGKTNNCNNWIDLTPNPLTPAMEEVINMRSKRVSVEVDIPITPDPSDDDDEDDDFIYDGVDDEEEDSNSSHEEYVPSRSSRYSKRRRRNSENPTKNSAKRRKKIPRVSVQNYISSPNKIRNKNSPKSPPVRRRISIQNDAELIVNKEPSTRKAKTIGKRKKTPVNETTLSSSSSSTSSSSSSSSSISSTSSVLSKKSKRSIPSKRKASLTVVSEDDPDMIIREISPQLKWDRILRTNPERMLKKKNLLMKAAEDLKKFPPSFH